MAGFGGSVKLTGETDYLKALKSITNNLTEINSEMKIVNSTYGRNDKSVQGLSEKNEVLNKKLEEQKKQYNATKQGLEAVTEEFGENSQAAQDWRIKLNKAEADVAKTTREINENKQALEEAGKAAQDNAEDIDDFAESEEAAGQGALKFGDLVKANLLSSAITSGIKALASAFKEVGSACVNIGKQALESYSSYEQLVGGVDTLFGESSSTVQEYADNAYKTAGMSANEYMETVTGFSASLLQSLGNDTQAAAEKADMAITDMSDNANKMGTDIESIQNAYQGFAKQNYTMLDNLKLGYGGTKEEMQRLLDDASKLSGIEYDISSYSDIVDAIHVVQTEMGITGTTANEASTTIEGSTAAVESAWSNLLTGIASGNSDVGNLVNNLVDSVMTAATNFLPRVQEIANGIVEVLPLITTQISDNLPTLLSAGMQILQTILEGIVSTIPELMPVVMDILNELTTFIIENLPLIITAAVQIISMLAQGIGQALPTLIPAVVEALITIVENLLDNIDMIIDAAIQLIMGLADGLISAVPILIDKIPIIIEKLITAIVDNLPKIIEMGIELIVKLAAGLISAQHQLTEKIPEILGALIKGIGKYFSNMKELGGKLLGKIKDGIMGGVSQMLDVGKNLVGGLWDGLTNSLSWIKDKISGWVGNVMDFIKGLFGIHSPSTLMRDEIGTNLALGIGEGFTDTMSGVTDEMANSIPQTFDVETSLNNNLAGVSSGGGLTALVSAFKSALSEFSATGQVFNITFDNFNNFDTEKSANQIADIVEQRITFKTRRATV